MPATTVFASRSNASSDIAVRKISWDDARAALREGWGDFMEMRGDLIFVGLLYPLIGVVAATAIRIASTPSRGVDRGGRMPRQQARKALSSARYAGSKRSR